MAIREYFGPPDHRGSHMLFYKLAAETSRESGCLNVFFTENQSRSLFKGLVPKEEIMVPWPFYNAE